MAVIFALGAVAGPAAPISAARTAAGAAQDDPQIRPLHMVVLVDESGSIDQESMDREKDAALLIALGEFSPGSTISVVGFASDNDGPGPQVAVDPVCPPTVVESAPDREALAACVQKLRKRAPNEGDSTDHVLALQQALSNLNAAPADQAKIVFLLTDGRLDVSNSEVYGKDNNGDLRNEAARQALRGQLDRASERGVQVWPLAFGSNLDHAQLDAFAAGGSQQTCGEKSPKPQAKVVTSADDVIGSMKDAFSSGRCAGSGALVTTTSEPGGTVVANVEIPAIATDGSIVVFRRDPRIAVSYEDPRGRAVPKSASLDDSSFQVSGESGPVEALRVVNPVPGTWKIKLTTPADGPRQSVVSTVLWQGAARAVLSVDPPAPTAGQQVTLGVRLQTRKNAITDAASLTGLAFSAKVGGEGFTEFPVVLADDGNTPDTKAGDGVFTGAGTVPQSATGALRFTGAVSGVGVQSDERTLDTRVAAVLAQVRAQVRLTDNEPFVPPGSSRPGELTVTNDTGKPQKVRLVVRNPGPGTVVSAEPAVFDLKTGANKFDFALAFAENTVIGANSGTIDVVDDANPAVVWHSMPFTAAVSYPPTLVEQLLWLWIVLAVLIAAALGYLLVRFAKRKRDRDVRGLRVQLTKAGRPSYLHAPNKPSQVFRFTAKEAGGAMTVNHATDVETAYELRRTDDGRVVLRHVDGRTFDLRPGQPESIAADVELTYHDERRPSRRPPQTRSRSATAPPATARPAVRQTSGPSAGPPADDDLL
ncbi:VWA domain-containing protein [Actinosynnema sp. CS-041913]|uniref:VWA domain-containing protein n=1 Tax=Actinosynnema sp. CS-041913 TaxID=3239917 RepID=UPI003D902778